MKRSPARIFRRKNDESPREAILRILKLRGEKTVGELCKDIKLTQTAVRRNLSALQQEGLISSSHEPVGKGRPTHRYKLTEQSARCFPSGYESVLWNLLETVYETGGHKGVMDFLRLNNDRVINAMLPGYLGKPLEQRVRALAKYFVDAGYMSDWFELPNGNFFLFHQNCAIHKLAQEFRQFCILEPRLIECLLGVKITRQQYILKGQPICGYLIDATRPLLMD